MQPKTPFSSLCRSLTVAALATQIAACGGSSSTPGAAPTSPEEAAWISTAKSSAQPLEARLVLHPEDNRWGELIANLQVAGVTVTRVDPALEPYTLRDLGVDGGEMLLLSRTPKEGGVTPSVLSLPLEEATTERLQELFASLATPPPIAAVHALAGGLDGSDDDLRNGSVRIEQLLSARGLSIAEGIPGSEADTDLLVLTTRADSVTPEEAAEVGSYLTSGGSMLLAIEPATPSEGLVTLLNTLGLSYGDGVLVSDEGVVREELGTTSPRDRLNHAAGGLLDHPSVGGLSAGRGRGVKVVVSGAGWLTEGGRDAGLGSSGTFSPTLLSSGAAFGDLNGDLRIGSGERQGAMVLAGASEGGAGSPYRAIVLSDATAISDRWLLHPVNRRFLEGALNWLNPNELEESTAGDANGERELLEFPTVNAFDQPVQVTSISFRDPAKRVAMRLRRDSAGEFAEVSTSTARGEERFVGGSAQLALFDAVEELQAMRRFAPLDEEKLDEFGLTEEGRTLIISGEGVRHELTIGANNGRLGGVYALNRGTGEVLLLAQELLRPISGPVGQMRETSLLPEREWRVIEVEVGGERVRLEPRDGKWVVAGRPAENRGITPWVTDLLAMQIDGDLPNGTDTTTELTAHFTDGDGGRLKLELGRATWRSDTLIIGRSDFSRDWKVLSTARAEGALTAGEVFSNALSR